jgi:hypothetical protein
MIVLRRHRLPTFYRVGLTVMWVMPLVIFVAAMIIGRGFDRELLNPRFLLPALIMITPALYFWREGIDVLPNGIYRRIHLPQYYAFTEMRSWRYDARDDKHVLTIWDAEGQIIIECRAGHLTEFPALLDVLKKRIS